ncbi:MAG: OB-fold nucleic acid binding domain-containing protein [Ornithinimicrobium sp.]
MSLATWMNSLIRSEADVEADEIAAECARPGCVTICTVEPGSHVTITGTVHSIAVPPQSQNPQVRVDLYDGSGIIELVWLGRRAIRGVETGAYLTVSGRVARGPSAGRLCIYNPAYDLLPARG